MRHNYESLGVDEFYKRHGKRYRNPHEIKINSALKKMLFNKHNEWISEIDFSFILDLCCGSGEMTLFLKKYLENSSGNTDSNRGTGPSYTRCLFGKDWTESTSF